MLLPGVEYVVECTGELYYCPSRYCYNLSRIASFLTLTTGLYFMTMVWRRWLLFVVTVYYLKGEGSVHIFLMPGLLSSAVISAKLFVCFILNFGCALW